ncbi:helix-turn-helix domain-containing protein [Ulvibacter antarcticus]|uniref:AraC family transcriptional regulator n=1 Tax=Ulvibacter antarcticus TaxID=442714 RepID=A0A3L9YBK8_9FLAO|nr:helix-turn-helix domain-containing protein [Ulvibacter antarcticus]RMA58021.1 AraC family transcriptional regulator [Ulvibacter antarcticus]
MNLNPDILKHIELLVGSIGVILSLFFAIFLLSNRKQQPKANTFLALYLLAFSLRIGKSLFYNYFPIDPIIRNMFLGILLAIGPSVWFYVSLLKNPNKELRFKSYIWHYVPMFVVIGCCWFIPNDSGTISRIFYYSLIVHMAIYSSYSLFFLLKNKPTLASSKEVKIHKWLLFFVITTLIMLLISILISTRIIPYYLGIAFLFSVVVICFSIWALKNPFLFKLETEKYSNSSLNKSEAEDHILKLNQLMNDEKLYLDPELKLSKLSKKIGVSSKLLSQAINQIENINYSQYITQYRVEEAKKRLASEAFENYKISAIAYDSGFNSLSSFNAAFKKHTSITAVQFRKNEGKK